MRERIISTVSNAYMTIHISSNGSGYIKSPRGMIRFNSIDQTAKEELWYRGFEIDVEVDEKWASGFSVRNKKLFYKVA